MTWTGDANAAGYKVEVRKVGGDWQAPDNGYASSALSDGITTRGEYEISLDGILNTSTTSEDLHGLAHANAYVFQVKATADSDPAYKDSEYSGEVRIVDTPISSANGDSRGRVANNGKAVVTWAALPGATAYTLRWRQMGPVQQRPPQGNIDHTQIGWMPQGAQMAGDWVGAANVTPPAVSGTAEGLRLGEVYALQLNYEYSVAAGPGGSTSGKGFSARESYVWPSATPAGNGQRVATFPLNHPLTGKTYSYRFCADTFPESRKSEWRTFVTHAISQWDLATNGLVTSNRLNTELCADYSVYVGPVLEKMLRYATTLPGGLRPTGAEMQAYVEGVLASAEREGIDTVRRRDRDWNEVLMEDDADAHTLTVTIFSEISKDVGRRYCGYACALRNHRGGTVDIHISNAFFPVSDLSVPGGDDTADAGEIPFNTCDGVDTLYGSIVHEAGHAMGIGGGTDGGHLHDGQGRHHSHIQDSSVSYDKVPKYSCSPLPLDVMALYALYQSR